MTQVDIKDAIATREYVLKDGQKVHIYIWTPTLQPSGEYGCPYWITGLGNKKIKTSFGIDSVQSLVLAMQIILVELCNSEEYKNGNLLWLDTQYLGLAVPKYLRDITPEK